jgi:sulfate adenylyltransferase subunit 2
VERNGLLLMVDDDRFQLRANEQIHMRRVRFRTLGCYPLTGAVLSEAETLDDILLELLQSHTSERQGRAIDTDESSSMEKKKQEGYF